MRPLLLPLVLSLASVAAAQPVYESPPDVTVTIENGVCYAERRSDPADAFDSIQVWPGTEFVVANSTGGDLEVVTFSPSGVDGIIGPDARFVAAGDTLRMPVYDLGAWTTLSVSIKCSTGTTPLGDPTWAEAATVVTLMARDDDGVPLTDDDGNLIYQSWLLGSPFQISIDRTSASPGTGRPDTGGMRPKPGGE